LSFDSSRISGSQLPGVWVGSVLVVVPEPVGPDPVVPDPTGWLGGDVAPAVVVLVPEATTPPEEPEAAPAEPEPEPDEPDEPDACGVTTGWAHRAPVGHDGIGGPVVVGVHVTAGLQPVVVAPSV
jgi:hypothetical protein